MKKLSITFLMLFTLIVSLASGGLSPQGLQAQGPLPDINTVLFPGENVTATKEVDVPPIPQVIDIFLLEDETGSFANDIATLKVLAPQIWDAIAALGIDFTMGVGGFRDYAQDNWGATNDWVYRRLQDLTTNKAAFVAGVNQLTASGGLDQPEAYLEALHYIATPGHAAIDSNGDGDTIDPIDTPTGRQPTWRPGARRVVLLTTDAPCHTMGDAGGWPGDPETISDVSIANVLNNAGITVIGLTPTGLGTLTCVKTLADLTGGSLQATTSSGALIKDAILTGIGTLTTDVWWVVTVPDPDLIIELAPTVYQDVAGSQTVIFEETVTVSPTASAGFHHAEVSFYVNGYPVPGALYGVQLIDIEVISPCEAVAPDFSICAGTTVNDQLFISHGAHCTGGCDMVITQNVNANLPGTYEYTVSCYETGVLRDQDTGIVTVVAQCVATAPDFSICSGTAVNDDLFISHGAECSEDCSFSISNNVNSGVPGVYQYTVTCSNGVCTPAQATGNVTVVAACVAAAPDFSICTGTIVNEQLFTDNGASCSQGCSMSISQSVNSSMPGLYPYTVTCDNGVCPPVQDAGTVTVVAACVTTAPDFSICAGTVINNQLFLDNGVSCTQGCTMSISHSINPNVAGTYPYTLTCDNGVCPRVQATGDVTVLEGCEPEAPDFSICTGTTINDQLFIDHGASCSGECEMSISHNVNGAVPGVYEYTVTCDNGECPPVQATGNVTVVAACVVSAPDFSICMDTTVNTQLFLDNGVSCTDGCQMSILQFVNPALPGDYPYTVTCDNGVCPPVQAGGTVSVVPPCTVEAPDFHICQFTPITFKLFTDHGAYCAEECCMEILRDQVDSSVPGVYEYSVICTSCEDEVCPPVVATGHVYVDEVCNATAPQFYVCRGTSLTDQLFIDNGVTCSEFCTLSLDYSQVNTAIPGDYPYTATCTNPCGPVSAQGTVTVCEDITGVAPTVHVCEGYTLDDLKNAVVAAGGGCDGGGCELTTDSVIDNGDGTYTLVCENACACVINEGELIVCRAPIAYAPPVELCEGYTQEDLEQAIEDAGGGCDGGVCGNVLEIVVDNADGTYTLICVNQCDCDVATGTISLDQCDDGPITLALEAGWNLISFPVYVEPGDRDPYVFFSAILGSIDSVYGYDACGMPAEWQTFNPGGPSSLLSVSDGFGYWMLMDAPVMWTPEGELLPEPPALPPTYDLCTGWNLIGVRSDVPVAVSDYLASIAGKFVVIYGYQDDAYFSVNTASGVLYPGLGYWIAMIAPGSIQH